MQTTHPCQNTSAIPTFRSLCCLLQVVQGEPVARGSDNAGLVRPCVITVSPAVSKTLDLGVTKGMNKEH